MTKKWLRQTLLLLGAALSFIIIFNLWMDPFWCYPLNHQYNSIQKGTNERQQKSNNLYFLDKKYDALLLGSSRTTYMDRHAFTKMQVFNYAARGMRPQEYITYLDFAIHDCKQPIKTIIIGMDFFGYLNYGSFMYRNAPSIIHNTKSPLYKYKILLSYDATINSFKNLRDYYNPHNHVDRYNRDNVKSSFIRPINDPAIHTRIYEDALHYAHEEYSSYPNPEFETISRHIKSKYSDKKFIIFTTPVSSLLFEQLIRTGHYKDYENWLRTLVNIYGEVHHFMYINSVAQNYPYYFADCNHAYTDTYTLVAHKITAIPDKAIPNDFGMTLTKENIDAKLNELRIKNGVK